ncbi:hypothetical protein ES703_103103 [subsurface metagenome]
MLDPKEEQKYRRLRKLAQQLHIPIPEAFWTLEVFDKDGKLLQRHHQRSHSWVRNAYNHLASQLFAKNADDNAFGAGKLNIKKGDASLKYGEYPIAFSYSLSCDDAPRGYLGSAAMDIIGIVAGTGTVAESFEDYKLQTKIDNGTTPGELAYVASEATAIGYADTTLTATLIRYFNNNSGGAIGVNEIGIIANGYVANGSNQWLQVRDKLATTVTVPDTGQLKVTYTIQLTYPA